MINKNILFSVCAVILISTQVCAQSQSDRASIQIVGTAEKEVVPDEIYISITLTESYSGLNKITIDQQEQELKNKIKALGIDLADLSLSNADAAYVKINWLNKDVLSKRNYVLKVSNTDMVGKVFQVLGDMDAKNASIARVDYAKKEELKKELRIKAIRDSKERAAYMLEAIGQALGKPISITESAIYPTNDQYPRNTYLNAKAVSNGQDNTAMNGDYIEFKKIKYTSNVTVKFEIK